MQTIILADSSGERTRYYFRQLLNYCHTVGKLANELTKEELKQFEVKQEVKEGNE